MALATRIRTAVAQRADERRRYRRLERELASFQTPAERAELDELISRHSPEDTRIIRQILHRQDLERQLTMVGLGQRAA